MGCSGVPHAHGCRFTHRSGHGHGVLSGVRFAGMAKLLWTPGGRKVCGRLSVDCPSMPFKRFGPVFVPRRLGAEPFLGIVSIRLATLGGTSARHARILECRSWRLGLSSAGVHRLRGLCDWYSVLAKAEEPWPLTGPVGSGLYRHSILVCRSGRRPRLLLFADVAPDP